MHASKLLTLLLSISNVLLSNLLTTHPKLFKILSKQCTSSISGILSIIHFPLLATTVAGKIATAAFFAPFISTEPLSALRCV